MRPKDRVIAAFQQKEADRVPHGDNQVDGRLVEQIFGRLHLYNMGWKEKNALWDGQRRSVVDDYCHYHVAVPQRLEWDYVRVPIVPADRPYPRPRMTGPYSWIDEDGHEVAFNPDSGNLAVRSRFPDVRIDQLPNPAESSAIDQSELEAIRHVVRELGESHFIVGRLPVDGTFPWEHTVGMEEFLIRMIREPEFVHRAVEAYVNRSLAYIEAMFDLGVDAVMTTDDYCDNSGPIMGASRFREFILPALARQCEAVHRRGGYFIKHTDGNVWDVLDSFVEIGVDGWHGIQPSIGMDLKRLKQRYGGRLCLFGGVNCETLITGTPQRVRQEVEYAITHSARGGGLVVTTSNVVQPGSRLENYLALGQAVRELGYYRHTPGIRVPQDGHFSS